MFKFAIDNDNATITVSIVNGPETTMYFPHGSDIIVSGDVFRIDGVLYTPTVEQAEKGLGRKIWIKREEL